MRIDGSNPAPAPEPEVPNKPHPAPATTAPVSQDFMDQHRPDLSSTNVVVEMQKGNVLVYKFIDEASGRVIEQIPSEGMLNLSEAIAASLQPKDKGK
jgi:hypothetical protein